MGILPMSQVASVVLPCSRHLFCLIERVFECVGRSTKCLNEQKWRNYSLTGRKPQRGAPAYGGAGIRRSAEQGPRLRGCVRGADCRRTATKSNPGAPPGSDPHTCGPSSAVRCAPHAGMRPGPGTRSAGAGRGAEGCDRHLRNGAQCVCSRERACG